MSAIFISHSSKDNVSAECITAWLRQRGHESLFLDFDPQVGIPAGRDWKKALFHQLRRCRAVIALCTDHFTASQWCLSELAIASNLGKSLFPIRLGTAPLPRLLGEFQAIDLTVTDPSHEGWERLARGLLAAGLDPEDTLQRDGKRPPYPGLMAFQEADAPLFFGREEAIREGLDQLRNLRDFGGRALLLVLGASGCGKSSLVRAGLVPKLRRDPHTWLVLDDWRLVCGHPEASVVLVIDQFEELLVEAATGQEERGSGLADRFLALLKDLLLPVDQGPSQQGRVLVIATLRSDFLGAFQRHPQLAALPFEDIKLGPMPVEGYTQVIEKPARIVGLELEEGLTQRLVADTRTGDALPMLASTLRELWETYGKDDGDLTLAEYGELGGLEGSVRRAADGVLRARSLGEPEIVALREAFLTMTRINEEGQYARVVARWADMPAASRPILERFVNKRLLVSGKDTGTIEVAHEALLRTWPVLQGWLKEGRERLEQQRKVHRLCDELRFAREKDRLEALRQLEALAVAGNPAIRLAG